MMSDVELNVEHSGFEAARNFQDNRPSYYMWRGWRARGVVSEWMEYEPFCRGVVAAGWSIGKIITRPDDSRLLGPDNCLVLDGRGDLLVHRGVGRVNNRLVTAWGEHKTVAEWARDPRARTTYGAIVNRLASGWKPEDAISTGSRYRPQDEQVTAWGETKSYMRWGQDGRAMATASVIRHRIKVLGWDPERAITTRQDAGTRGHKRWLITAWGETKHLKDWILDARCRVSYQVLRSRILNRWAPELAISTDRFRRRAPFDIAPSHEAAEAARHWAAGLVVADGPGSLTWTVSTS